LLFIFLKEKKREIEFLLLAVLFIYGSGTVQNRFFGGIRYLPFFPEGKRRSEQD
jgi:hypothetical protein